MAQIEQVETVEEWVFRDLSSSNFNDEEQRTALAGVDDVEEDLVTWGRPIRKVMKQVEHQGNKTVYRYRKGDLRLYFIRKGDTMYCIGIGKRKKTYDRDLEQMSKRANEHPPE
jgi:mRNA-degrading endonuclease RelE of RelBE toxin-antitoxin system